MVVAINKWDQGINKGFRNKNYALLIHEKRYGIIPFLNKARISIIEEIYTQKHPLNLEIGRVSYSLYSNVITFHKRLNTSIRKFIKEELAMLFVDYKNARNFKEIFC